MIEISIPLEENGVKRSEGELIEKVAEELRGKHNIGWDFLKLKGYKIRQRKITLKYDVVQDWYTNKSPYKDFA